MADKKVSDARKAIDAVFSDTSVSPGTTRSRLEELRDYINENISTLAETAEDEDDLEADR